MPDRLLVRGSALRRSETGAGEGERREHALLQQRFVGFAGNRLGDMAGDGVADIGVREALAAGGLGFRGKNSGDEAAPRCDQFFGCLGPDALHPVRKVRAGAGGVDQQMMQRADAPAARHFDVGQQCGQRVVQGQPPVVFEHGEQRGRHRLGDRPDVPAVVDVHRNARTPPALAAGGRPGKLPVGHHGRSHPGEPGIGLQPRHASLKTRLEAFVHLSLPSHQPRRNTVRTAALIAAAPCILTSSPHELLAMQSLRPLTCLRKFLHGYRSMLHQWATWIAETLRSAPSVKMLGRRYL